MNTHLTKILHYTRGISTQVKLWYKEQPKNKQIAIAVLAFIIVGVIVKSLFGGDALEEKSTLTNRKVIVSPVSSLSNKEGDFSLVGTVTSVSEATIRSEGSGKLTRVYKKLGDSVYAGGVIAEFENSSERASVLQAEGAYDQAKASRDITRLNSGQAGSSLTDTKNQSLNALYSAYASMDDAIHGKTDSAYSDAKFSQVKLILAVPDANLVNNLEAKRRAIEGVLIAREAKNKTLTTGSDLIVELTTIQNEVQMMKTYLDDLYTAYSKAIPDANFSQVSLESGKANVQSARQSISGVLSSLISSRAALSASITGSQVAGNQGNTQTSGALASADAQVKQALGAYNGALSRLEKTIIRSPITGTLNSLSISTGDYIGAFTQVAVVSNNGALEVVSFVTEDDAKRVTVGSPVVINAAVAGVITRIASAIDPMTKKIEVRIGIKDAKSSLVNGQSVRVAITKNKKDVTTQVSGPIVIPLSALKLTPRGANVFVISSSSTLVAVPVTEGAILGEQIQVLSGLNGTEEIVVDARGLKEGSVVEVATQ